MASEEATYLLGGIFNWTVEKNIAIRSAMQTNAQWEIWLQVEMALFLKEKYGDVIREANYDDSRKSLDIIVQYKKQAIAIELKTESLKTGLVSGQPMFKALMSDMGKLQENKLSELVREMECNRLTLIVIGIGHASKYQKDSQKVLEQGMNIEELNTGESFAVKVLDEFGVYGFVDET